MLCLSGFELYSRWVPLRAYQMLFLKAIKYGCNRLRLFNPLSLEQGQVSKLIFENDAIRNRIFNDFNRRCISQPKAQ